MSKNTAAAKTFEALDDDFRRWIETVSRKCNRRWGLQLDDLPDLRTRDAFEAGLTPEQFFDEEVMNVMREEFGGLAELEEED